VRPGGFGLIAHVNEAFGKHDVLLVAPYETDADKWPHLDWRDAHTGQPVRIITAEMRLQNPERFARALQRGDTVINTLGDVLGNYLRRPEHKSLAPDGQRCGPDTTGLLQRRPIESAPALTDLIGKESNKLSDRLAGAARDVNEYQSAYGARDPRWETLVLPALKDIGAAALIEQTGMARSSVYDVLAGAIPHPSNRGAYEAAAVEHASRHLTSHRLSPRRPRRAILWLFVDESRRARRGAEQH